MILLHFGIFLVNKYADTLRALNIYVLQSNSLIEWSFRKAITIRTFSNYHPIPVPLNLLSQLGILSIQCIKSCRWRYGSRNCYSQIPHSGEATGEDQAGIEKVW